MNQGTKKVACDLSGIWDEGHSKRLLMQSLVGKIAAIRLGQITVEH